jgi:hypothetical protein
MPQPIVRVLSDGKMEKPKKIALTIAEDKKSKSLKRLTLCNSL